MRIVISVLLAVAISSFAVFRPAHAAAVPGKWKWYYAVFNDVGALATPSIFWGTATVTIKGSAIQIKMQESAPGGEEMKFSGTINANHQIDGVLDGILLEDPRPNIGHYRKLNLGSCSNEVIVLEEKFRMENQVVLRRGLPSGC